MASGYTPGLLVSAHQVVRKTRELPLPGKEVVSIGQKVAAESTVLEAQLPGDLAIVRLAERMGVDPIDIAEGIKVKEGDTVKTGDLLCEVSYLFGLGQSQYHSPCDGTVEFFTEINGHLGIRHAPVAITVAAYLSGTVVEVDPGKSVTIESPAAIIQGIFGVGGERNGVITPLAVESDAVVEASDIARAVIPEAAILVGGASFSIEALNAAADKKVAAVVTGSIDSETLAQFIGFEIGVSITGDEKLPFTLIVTEGFGKLAISQRILEIIKQHNNLPASVNGATQVRAGAMRPEVIIPHQNSSQAEQHAATQIANLEVGAKVRIIRAPHFGLFATVTELTEQQQKIESGAEVRVLKAELEGGNIVVVPRANVELV